MNIQTLDHLLAQSDYDPDFKLSEQEPDYSQLIADYQCVQLTTYDHHRSQRQLNRLPQSLN